MSFVDLGGLSPVQPEAHVNSSACCAPALVRLEAAAGIRVGLAFPFIKISVMH